MDGTSIRCNTKGRVEQKLDRSDRKYQNQRYHIPRSPEIFNAILRYISEIYYNQTYWARLCICMVPIETKWGMLYNIQHSCENEQVINGI